MKTATWMLTITLGLMPVSAAWAAQGEGLTPNTDELPWSRWQARVSLGTAAPLWRADFSRADSTGLKVNAVGLLGDFYFSRALSADGHATGFRTTSGVIVGPRSALGAMPVAGPAPGSLFSADRRLFGSSAGAYGTEAADSATLPYLGIGYSGLSARGGWSVTADLGLVALAPGQAVKLGRVFNGGQALDETLRDMRLSPLLQLGVSYSF